MGRARAALTLACVALACGKPAPRAAPELAAHLAELAAADEPTRAAAVARWELERAAWERTVVEPYRGLHAEYVAAFGAAQPALVAALAEARPIAVRPHFAGDAAASRAQAVARWALPTLAPTRVAAGLDAVFVEDGAAWRAIVGLDVIVQRRIAALDPACAPVLEHIDPAGGRCIEAAWTVADAALRGDRARFVHACGIATNLCGKRSP